MRKVSSDLRIVIGLLVLVIVVGIIIGGRQGSSPEVEIIPRRTTYSARASGTKALYTTLSRLGYSVHRHLDKLTVSPADGILFIISPELGISQEEWAALQSWIERGNTLILASSKDVTIQAVGDMPPMVNSTPICPSFLSPGVKSFAVPEGNRIDDGMLYLDDSDSFAKSFGRGPSSRSRSGHSERGPGKPLVPLLGWQGESTVGYSRWGAGEVIVFAGGWPISNQGIKTKDNLILVLNALEHRDPSHKLAVTFDEYHHGYSQGKGMASLISLPAKLGLAQIALAFLILVFATSRRFAREITLREGARQRGEYLSSMSALLKKAHATEIVRVELGKRFMSDAASALGLAPSAGPDEIIEAATRRRPDKLVELQQLLAAATTAADDDETRILSLAIRWHRMRKELQR